ncbi:aldo/keto reductase [Edaphobacter sp. DSM 109919]|uniref:Aldo/keto reductase n=1 Tax=Edaphobacter paludis TaxID=3035702 RepID=A0AAU7CWK4_9BACT
MQATNDKSFRRLGATGPRVFPLALGCMGMSGMYGQADEAESLRTIHTAIEAGVTLLDTGDFYGMGHNELLVGRALREMGSAAREKVMISVKFGALRGPDGSWLGFDGRPAAVKNSLAHSLTRLGVDYIDIYRPARLDGGVPIEETVGAVAEMVSAGYVRHVALSEVGVETARRAKTVTPICDVQLEYGLASRGIEGRILPGLREMGIGVTAYGVLSRGLLSGSVPQAKGDFRARLPRFTGENLAKNQALATALKELAAARNLTAVQMAIAWVLAKGEDIVPLIGSRTQAQINEALGALDVRLSKEEISKLEIAVPASEIAGTRYDSHQMAMLDSEK